MQKPKVSLITVAYRAEEELFSSLATLRKQKFGFGVEVIVVDNNEKAGLSPKLKREFPQVKYIKSSGNIGFSAGNNLGAHMAGGKYLFFLNPDTKLIPGSLSKLVQFLDRHPNVAIVSPTLVDESGRPYELMGTDTLTPINAVFGLSFINKLFPNNPISRKFWLKDVRRDKSYRVGVAPGAAMLMPKRVFSALGGFDENFFLYFEESDLGKRAFDVGLSVYILPEAKVVHFWQRSTIRGPKIEQIFGASRFYYFKKHFGIIPALVINTICGFSKWQAFLLGTLVLGAFLRFFRINETVVFHSELGHNYLAIKNAFATKTLPLLGPPTSHPWLSFGPLFYWLFGPILAAFKFNPVVGSYFFAVVETVLIALNFCVIKKFFGAKVAGLSSFLIAISPAWLKLTREARFFSLAAFFFYPFFYFLIEKELFWAGLFLGIMFNFHLSPIILLLPTGLYLFFNRNFFNKNRIFQGLVGFLLPNVPFLIYNSQNQFEMLKRLLVWIPYRIAGFFGLYPKNTVSVEVLKHNALSLYEYVGGMLTPDNRVIALLILMMVIVFVVMKLINEAVSRPKNWPLTALLFFFVFGYLGIFIVGDAPSHYYLPIYPLPIIFFSLILTQALSSRRAGYLLGFILLGLAFLNCRYYFSDKWFYLPQNEIFPSSPVPFNLQTAAAGAIIANAQGQKFVLHRVGPHDNFEGDYAQNYRYLLWWKGNEPVETAAVTYTIYEVPPKLGQTDVIFQQGGLSVVREENEKK